MTLIIPVGLVGLFRQPWLVHLKVAHPWTSRSGLPCSRQSRSPFLSSFTANYSPTSPLHMPVNCGSSRNSDAQTRESNMTEKVKKQVVRGNRYTGVHMDRDPEDVERARERHLSQMRDAVTRKQLKIKEMTRLEEVIFLKRKTLGGEFDPYTPEERERVDHLKVTIRKAQAEASALNKIVTERLANAPENSRDDLLSVLFEKAKYSLIEFDKY
jgi:hypothetical protein